MEELSTELGDRFLSNLLFSDYLAIICISKDNFVLHWLIDDIFVIGCIPDFPINRTWGCCNCDAAFFKDTPRNRAALGGLVPHQWPKD